MTTRNDLIYPKKKVDPEDNGFMLSFNVLKQFVQAIDEYWRANNYRSRTHFIFSLVAKKIKWKGSYLKTR